MAHSLIYAGTPVAKGYYRSGSTGSTFISASQKVYVLVPYVWTGNGDGKSWSEAANWDSNTVPQDGYDTVVDLSAATNAVELAADVTVGCAIANPTGGVCTVTGDATLKTYGPSTWGPVLLVGDNRTFEFDVNIQRQSGPFYRAMGGGTLRFKKDVPGYGRETGNNTWTASWQMLVNVEYAGETTVRAWNSTSGGTLIHEGIESGRQKVTLADGAKVTVSGNFGINVAGVPFGPFVQENAEVAANAFYLNNLSSDRPTHYLMKDGKLSLTSGNQPGFQMGTRYTSAAYLPGGTFRQEGGRVWTPKFSSACYGQKLELVGGTFEVGAYGLLLDTTQSYSDYEDYKDLCAIRFAGGTLKATAAWMKTEVGIECTAAGGTLDTGANNVTFAAPIRGAGGFTKTGAGTLTLTSADNAFSSLAVSGGVVKFDTAASAPAGLDLNLASRASLDVPAGVTLEAANVTVNGRVCSRGRTLACGAGHVHVNAGPLPSPLIITIQ